MEMYRSIVEQHPGTDAATAAHRRLDEAEAPVHFSGTEGAKGKQSATVEWPSSKKGLLLAIENGRKPLVALDRDGDPVFSASISRHGLTRLGPFGEFLIEDGCCIVGGFGTDLVDALKTTNALTFEAYLTPSLNGGSGAIFAFVDDGKKGGFVLAQQENMFVVRFPTPSGEGEPIPLFPVHDPKRFGVESVHLTLTFAVGSLRVYKNGTRIEFPLPDSKRIPADFKEWTARNPVLGGESKTQVGWRGRMEGIVLYNRALDPAEVNADKKAWDARGRIPERTLPPRARVIGTLVGHSPFLTPEQTGAYTRSLTTCEYRVDSVISGSCAAKTIHVAHWSMLDGKMLPISRDAKIGKPFRLTLEPFEAYPELESECLSHTLDIQPDIPFLFDCGVEPVKPVEMPSKQPVLPTDTP
jgi:hypothetical protein